MLRILEHRDLALTVIRVRCEGASFEVAVAVHSTVHPIDVLSFLPQAFVLTNDQLVVSLYADIGKGFRFLQWFNVVREHGLGANIVPDWLNLSASSRC
jgi:hypothetical protein